MSRSLARLSPFVILLALGADSSSLVAQRQEVSARRPPRAPVNDAGDAQLRRLRSMIDSLARTFDDQGLSAVERDQVGEELDRHMNEFMALAARQAEAQGALRRTRSELEVGMDRLMMPNRSGALVEELARARMAREATPRGWIGIEVTGPNTGPRLSQGQMLLRYLSYPQIASVDPSSPAQRAGILPLDTLLAYNGRDVRDEDIPVTKLLVPNARLMVRIRRDGRVRELPVVVDTVPTRIRFRSDDRIRYVQVPMSLDGLPDLPPFPRPPQPAPAPRSVMIVRRPDRPARPPAPMSPPMTVAARLAHSFASGGVAGADMVTVTEGLGKSLGLRSGVLVTTVPVGSPASESGLRDGDVILRANGEEVRTLGQLRDIVARAADRGERAVAVEYQREKRRRQAALRW